jgi:bis(5'-nucleosidyl)-tetraphosphatase
MDAEEVVHETSYGIIPFKKIDNIWHVLLVKHHAGHWAFPKGHPEEGETSFQTAKREFFEETGLSVSRFFDVSPLEEKYQFKQGKKQIVKTVWYFLAEVAGEVKLQRQELADSLWVEVNGAASRATFPETQSLCRQAAELIPKH